jgi:hypothetical protein
VLDREKHGALEQANLTAYDQSEQEIDRKFNDMLAAANPESAETFFGETTNKLAELNQQYLAYASISERINKKKYEFTQWHNRFQEAGQKYQELKSRVATAVNNNQFDTALKLIADFMANWKNTIYDGQAKAYLQETERLAEKSFSDVWKQVGTLINNGALVEAQNLLNKIAGTYGVETIEKTINEKLDWFRTQAGTIKERLLAKEALKYPATYITLYWLLQRGLFDELDKKRLEAEAQYQTKEWQDALSRIEVSIDSEENIFKQYIARLSKNETNQRLLQNKEIVAIDNGVIKFKDDRIKVAWPDISAGDWAQAISTAWNLSAQEYYDLGILCMRRGGLDKKAEECFDAAKVKSTEHTFRASVDKCKKQLDTLRKTREDEAAALKERAERFFNARKYTQALDGWSLLKSRFRDTAAYSDNKINIEKHIGECEKNIINNPVK